MRFQGLVSLAMLVAALPAFGQVQSVPRLLGSPDAVQLAPDARPNTQTFVPPRSYAASTNQQILESELEALRSDLQSFHTLSEEIARSARDVEAKTDSVSSHQRKEVLELLTKLATQGMVRKAPKPTEDLPPLPRLESTPTPTQDDASSLQITDSVIDPFALAKVLFKDGDFAKAELALGRVKQTDDNRELVKYMIATCKYRRKRIPEAVTAYKELTESQDPVIRDLAKFQLDGIRWIQQVEQELNQLRKERDKAARSMFPKIDGAKK